MSISLYVFTSILKCFVFTFSSFPAPPAPDADRDEAGEKDRGDDECHAHVGRRNHLLQGLDVELLADVVQAARVSRGGDS